MEMERSLTGGVLLDFPFDPDFGAQSLSDEDDLGWLSNPPSPGSLSPDLFRDFSSDHVVLSRTSDDKSDTLTWDSILHGVHGAVPVKTECSVMWDGSDSVLEDDEFGPPPALRSIFGHMPTEEELQFQNFIAEECSSSSDDDVFIADGHLRRPKKSTKQNNNKRYQRTKAKSATAVIKAKKAALATMQRKTSPAVRAAHMVTNMPADSPEARRHTHNVLERKRREDLKSSYRDLRVQVPELACAERAPTGQILIKASEYIAQLQAEEQKMLRDLQTLRAQNANLQRMQAGVCS
jgi:hypothetical protein